MILVELEQPFAEMVVRDLINVLHLKRRADRMTREVVIYARKPRKNPAIPLEWIQEVINQQKFGNLPPTEDLPTEKVVGVVKILYKAEPNYNIWSLEPPTTSYVVGNACVLDEPLDVSCDEVKRWKNLPQDVKFHSFEPAKPHFRACDFEIVIPVCGNMYYQASQGKPITFEFAGKLANLMKDRFDGSLIPFENMRLVCGQRCKRFYFIPSIEEEMVDGTPKRYPSVLSDIGRSKRKILSLECIAKYY